MCSSEGKGVLEGDKEYQSHTEQPNIRNPLGGKTLGRWLLCSGRSSRELNSKQGLRKISQGSEVSRVKIARFQVLSLGSSGIGGIFHPFSYARLMGQDRKTTSP